MLESVFKLKEHGTTARTELLAGVTTFLTMAYIAFVNPPMLEAAGMDFGAVFVATCLAAAIGTLIMGLVANYPVALAPGMGLNAFFAYGVVLGMGVSWQIALGAVFVSGVLFITLSVLPVREAIINAIPASLKMAISAGIGLMLGVIGLQNAGLVVDDPVTLLTMGDMLAPSVLLALAGFVFIVALEGRGISGAVIIGILVTTLLSIVFGVSEWRGLVSIPPDPTPTLFQLDLVGALNLGMITVILTLLFTDLFDTTGTLVGLAHRAKLLDARGKLPRVRRALLADSTATAIGATLGTSTTTSYIESAAGIKAGGRTGLTAVTVAGLFLLCLFFSPLAQSIPEFATAPALLFVASYMMRGLVELNWDDMTEVAPAVLTVLAIPLTFSIADGIGIGFVTYTAIKILSGRVAECSVALAVIAVIFALKFVFL